MVTWDASYDRETTLFSLLEARTAVSYLGPRRVVVSTALHTYMDSVAGGEGVQHRLPLCQGYFCTRSHDLRQGANRSAPGDRRQRSAEEVSILHAAARGHLHLHLSQKDASCI